VKAVFLLGPTASGKSAVALELAERFPMEIVSVDSAQVYRGLDVGTAKPDAATRKRFPHHLVDIVDPTEAYSAGRFRADALRLIGEIHSRGRIPLLAGGTMLYFRALTKGLADLPPAQPKLRAEMEARAAKVGWPALHAELAKVDTAAATRIDRNDAQRIQRALEVHRHTGRPLSDFHGEASPELPFEAYKLSLEPSDRSALHARIAERFRAMLAAGLVDELRGLRERYALTAEMPSMRSVGYRQAWHALDDPRDMALLEARGVAATRQLAKRQLTWLRAMDDVERMDCLQPGLAHEAGDRVDRFLSRPRGT
jgi:tRNA dimethylallyltransferase